MAQMSKRFNFDDFDELCREALDELDEAGHEPRRLQPGDIGAVICTPLCSLWFGPDDGIDLLQISPETD